MDNFEKLNRAAGSWTAVLVFLFPFLSLVTLFGVSLVSFLFLFSALFLFGPCRAALARHWGEVRWVVLAFGFNAAVALLYWLARPEATANHMEKPMRMLLAVSALALVLAARPPRRALWWGVTAGALAALPLVAWQRLWLGLDRPGGLINPITFGDLALCLALVALAATADLRASSRQAAWPALGALAGLAASLLTGTRGGLVALLLALLLFARNGRLLAGRRLRALLLAGVALFAGAWFAPELGIQARMAEGVSNVRAWYAGASVNTNVGIRLELWKGAAMLVAEHPLAGIDQNLVKAALGRHVRAGRLDPVVLEMPHLHNDALQGLVTGGVAGLLAWAAILAAPFAFFARAARVMPGAAAPALAGMLVVICYFSFGLTEVIFWSVKGSLFYALMVFLLMGLCLNTKEEIGN